MKVRSSPSLSHWISQHLKADPPRSKSVLMTVFGDSITPRGGAVWLGSLMSLLQPFGISDRLVRTSVFRLAEEGWLEAERQGRRSLYRMTASGARRFERAHRRIYFPDSGEWNGQWTLLMWTADTLAAGQRASLKKELLWEGYGMLAPGVFIHPRAELDALQDILERTKSHDGVLACAASDLPQAGARPLQELVAQCWQLEQVAQGYHDFLKAFAPLQALLQKKPMPSPEQAFVIRTLLIHAFRRVHLHDPRLPLALLPADWPGEQAYALCQAIYQQVCQAAEEHVNLALQAEEETVRLPGSEFYQRFGGLQEAVAA